jgi:hypothetical protein
MRRSYVRLCRSPGPIGSAHGLETVRFAGYIIAKSDARAEFDYAHSLGLLKHKIHPKKVYFDLCAPSSRA